MLTAFENMPGQARIWIYQSNRGLTPAETQTITAYLEPQVDQWAAHGAALQAGITIKHNRFVIVALNEAVNAASGCSIDASTRWFKELGAALNIDFFDRSLCYVDANQSIQSLALGEIKAAVATQQLLPQSLVFNNTVKNIMELNERWLQRADNSWTARYFQKTLV